MSARAARRSAPVAAAHPAYVPSCQRCAFHAHPCRAHLDAALRKALKAEKQATVRAQAAEKALALVKGEATRG